MIDDDERSAAENISRFVCGACVGIELGLSLIDIFDLSFSGAVTVAIVSILIGGLCTLIHSG